ERCLIRLRIDPYRLQPAVPQQRGHRLQIDRGLDGAPGRIMPEPVRPGRRLFRFSVPLIVEGQPDGAARRPGGAAGVPLAAPGAAAPWRPLGAPGLWVGAGHYTGGAGARGGGATPPAPSVVPAPPWRLHPRRPRAEARGSAPPRAPPALPEGAAG